MKINKYTALAFNTFFLIPIAAIPFIIVQLKRGSDKGVILFLSLFTGVLSMRYVPSFTNDKVRYIERSNIFSSFSIQDLFEYYISVSRPDYVFDFLIFLYSKLKIDIRFFFFCITALSIYVSLNAIKKILQSSTETKFRYNIIVLILFITAFSVPAVLSGLRYFLAGSIYLWFIYFFIFRKNYLLSSLLLTISILTHFSYSLVTIAILISLTNPQDRLLKPILLLSTAFFLVPESFSTNILSLLPTPEIYINKVELYTTYEFDNSINSIILNFIKSAWYFFALIYLFFKNHKGNKSLYYMCLVLAVIINLMYPFQIVFFRYISFYKIIFAIYLAYLSLTSQISNKSFYFFIFLYLLGFIIDIFILRINLLTSYLSTDNILLFTSFLNKEGLYDFLYYVD